MSDEIKPALTEAQWQRIRAVGPAKPGRWSVDGLAHAMTWGPTGHGYNDYADVPDADMHAMCMALHNDALPDGDPRKRLHQDVDALRDIAAESPCLTDYQRYVVERVAGIIAALLPPRG